MSIIHKNRKGPLRKGTWIDFGNLHPQTTVSQLREFLYDHGIEIPEDDMRMHYDDGVPCGSATIVMPKTQIIELINWSFDGGELFNHVPKAQLHRGDDGK